MKVLTKQQTIRFQQSLPIFDYKAKIEEMVCNNDICIITGDTGSGKTTQLPQYMLDSQIIRKSINRSGTCKPLRVIVTQPRRIAAASMASRVAMERKVQMGTEVGYTIRFHDNTSPATLIRYTTDGIFVRQCINDPLLQAYDVVILDEAHERSLFTDILFALMKKAVRERKGRLKLIITSATLNTKSFSAYYENCPVLHMHGKLYPVEVKYQNIKQSARVEEAVTATLRMHLHQGPGDILVFLTGSEECEAATHLCEQKLESLIAKGREVPGMIIYQLYGALSTVEQARVFQKTPEGIRKVVFATNIAETSVTIDNIGFVVDCGYAKQKQFNPRTNMDSLVTIPISKVQAIQRKGRAGRTQDGKCLRLYSEKFYQEMKDYTLPEILRVSLSSVVLTLKSMKVTDLINFQYMESPDKQALFKALNDLFLLGALNQDGNITDLGYQMSRFPLQPQFSKAIIISKQFNCLQKMITLVSLLSTESLWQKVFQTDEQQYSKYLSRVQQFVVQTGDHQTLLNIYDSWTKCEDPNKFCDENYLNFRALRQADNIKNQLYEIVNASRSNHLTKDPHFIQYMYLVENYKQIPQAYLRSVLRRCLAMAFYFNSARLRNNTYILNHPEGTVAALDPHCALALQHKDSQALIYTELSAGKLCGLLRNVSVIDHKWVEPYLKNIALVDTFRLAGVSLQRNRVVQQKVEESQENKLKRVREEREDKIKTAKERYQGRKRVKTQMMY